jgi:regulator of nucleoside diphosphate kinase
MNPRDIYITEFDLNRLRDVLKARINSKVRDRDHLDSLENELDRAHVVDPSAIPHDVVTMNSQVRIVDVDTGMENVYTLVFPSEASIPEKKISILAPIGTALLGSRAGGTVDWPVPAGMRTVKIKEVLYQPEASGDYHL